MVTGVEGSDIETSLNGTGGHSRDHDWGFSE
jgi:hypothetical protein